jgi:hypothetical protein
LPVVTRKHIHHDNSLDNDKLNEIRRKLRDPKGHMTLMEKSAILSKKQRNSLGGKESLATIEPTTASGIDIGTLANALSGNMDLTKFSMSQLSNLL